MQTNNPFPLWQIRDKAFKELFMSDLLGLLIGSSALFVFAAVLVIMALVGFSFYLWYMKSNNDHTHSRLLNILNGYLAFFCMSGSIAIFYSLQLNLQLNHGVHQQEVYQRSVRVSGAHLIAISITFLIISVATILNHFKPNIYLEISVTWSHKVAIPTLLCFFLLIDQATHMYSDQCDKYIECRVDLVRKMVMIPCTAASFLCQIVVLTDDVFNLKNIYNRLASCIRSLNTVSPVNNVDNIELVVMETPPQPPPPPQNPSHPGEFISLTTGFMTLCLFNMLVLLISFITTVFEVKI